MAVKNVFSFASLGFKDSKLNLPDGDARLYSVASTDYFSPVNSNKPEINLSP